VVDGASAAVALLHEEREPVLKPGAPCAWCARRVACEVGQRHLAERADEGW
jgi:hypothetical protein